MYNFISKIIKKYFKNFTGLPKICWLGLFLIFIDAVAGGICFFLSLYFVNDLKLNVKTSGFLISSYGLGTVIGGIFGGKLSDTISPKLISKISLILQAIAFLFLIKVNSVAVLTLNLLVMGITAYIFKTSVNCWILNQPGLNSELRLKILNIARVASNLGLAISGSIVGVFAKINFLIIFFLSSGIFFISALIMMLNEDRKSMPVHNIDPEKIQFYSINGNKRILIPLILMFVFLIGLIIGQLGTTYPIYIQNSFKNLGIEAVSILFILDTILIVMFQAPLVNLIKKHNKIFFMGIGGLLIGCGLLILNISSFFYLAIISCIIMTTGEMLFIPLSQLLCYENGIVKQGKGKSIGTYQTVYALGTICGPILGGMIYHDFGGEILWYASGMIGLSCFLVFNYLKKYH